MRADAEEKPPIVMAAANPELLRRRRLAIAELLNSMFYFRTLYTFKLSDAKLSGPFERKYRDGFTSPFYMATFYCVTAWLESPLIPTPKNATIQVKPAPGGAEQFVATAPGVSWICSNQNYGPFPELEEVRARTRQRLGKTD